MRVLITGSSYGMGNAIAKKFCEEGHEVIGVDVAPCPENLRIENYTHFVADVSDVTSLPEIPDVEILINNAGVQDSRHDIDVNLKGVINTTKKYAYQDKIKSVLNQASVSAHNGAEFGEYVASKGGVLSYTIYTAKQLVKYGATCNSLSFGGVLTDLNKPVMDNQDAWNEIMQMTPLKKWASVEEAAEWAYFLTVINKSCTGQDVIIDNGEFFNHKFVWN